jgi:hypothetical protein
LDASAKVALRLAVAGSFFGPFAASLVPAAAQDAGVLYRETFDVPPSI